VVDTRVLKLKTPEDCEKFAKNAEKLHPDIAKEARRRGVELRAAAYGAKSDAEREALAAIFAVEEVKSTRSRRAHASRTWQSVKRHGILETVERVVRRAKATEGYAALVAAGMDDFTFEAVVIRHEALFEPSTVERARQRVEKRKATKDSAPAKK
jgi:hypothetical protein